MLQSPISEEDLPLDIGKYRLLSILGGGVTSQVFRAEPLSEGVQPECFALKIACRKPNVFNVDLTEEAAHELFGHQREILRKLNDHPYIAKAYLEILPEKQDQLAMELGVCSVQDLQIMLGPHGKPSPSSMPFDNPQNSMPAAFVKYFAASRFLGLAHIHSKDVIYCDIMPYNMLIMPDFTLKAIDIGEIRPEADRARDARHLVCNLYYLLTGDGEAYRKPEDWLKERLSGSEAREKFPLYFGMMLEYLDHHTAEKVLGHPFWSSEEAGPGIRLAAEPMSAVVENMKCLVKAAWMSLPKHARVWLLERGVLSPVGTTSPP